MILFRTFFAWSIVAFLGSTNTYGRDNKEQISMVRLSRLVINASRLADYKTALTEEIAASLRIEPGVLTLYAVFERDRPTQLTILEIYADRVAYESHIKSAHFIKYKASTAHMVESLELLDAVPLFPATTMKMSIAPESGK